MQLGNLVCWQKLTVLSGKPGSVRTKRRSEIVWKNGVCKIKGRKNTAEVLTPELLQDTHKDLDLLLSLFFNIYIFSLIVACLIYYQSE